MKNVSGLISGVEIKTQGEKTPAPVKQKADASPDESLKPRIHADVPQGRVESMRMKALKADSLRIKESSSAAPSPVNDEDEIEEFDRLFEEYDERVKDCETQIQQEESAPIVETPQGRPDHRKTYIIGGALTVLWLAFAHAYAISPASDISPTPMGIAVYLAGICAPLILLWLVLTTLMRRQDTAFYAASSFAQLQGIMHSPEDAHAHISESIAQLQAQRSDFSAFAGNTTETLSNARQSFREDLSSFRDISIQAEARIDAMAARLEERIEKLTTLTETIESRAAHIDNVAQSGLKGWDQVSETILEQCNNMERSIQSGVAGVNEAIERAAVQSKQVQESWQESSDILEGNLERSAIRLQDLAVQFTNYNEKFESSTAALSSSTQRIEQDLKSNIELSEHAALAVQNRVRDAIEALRMQGESADETSHNIATKIDTAAAVLTAKINHFGTSMASVINDASDMVEGLDNGLDARQKALRIAAADLEKNAHALDEVGANISLCAKELESASSNIDGHANILKNKAAGHMSAVQNTVDDIHAASEKAALMVKALREEDARMQRDNVIASSKFLIEGLHSLSVDLSRMVHGYISEKMWKLYQRGDIETFTRELFKSGQNDLKAAQDKYKEDGTFRTCANRYMRQFDDLYAQATENDHGGLLSATFASSEVGRLYAVLCIISGKPNKAQKLSQTVI